MTNRHTNIFLIGLMGSGKTTAARHLARIMNKTFIDSDHEIESRTGVKIPLIFEYEGETGFRSREAAILDELTQRENIILATGGGAILNESTRQHLKNRGIVIYLKASLQALTQRTSKDPNRPLLQSGNAKEKLRALLQEREPLYLETADLIFDTTKGHTKNIAMKIKHAVNTFTAQLNNHDTHHAQS